MVCYFCSSVQSCIVPVRNGGKWLEKCLDSILQLEVPSGATLQVSVYDDGSEDNTASILKSHERLFCEKSIEFVISTGVVSKGVGYAKNRAVDQSTGEYLCFCDADDVFMPHRITVQLNALLCSEDPFLAFVGGRFVRDPANSTCRYTKWANGLSKEKLYTEIYTSHGPTLIAPTWFFSRRLFDTVGGFNEVDVLGYPEDLEFFYSAVRKGAKLIRVDDYITVYRYHLGCASLKVSKEKIWLLRVEEISLNAISKWRSFTIWNAGKEGKRFFKSLSHQAQKKVIAFCDVDAKKISRGCYENYDHITRIVTAKVPIIPVSMATPPVIICVKLDLSGGIFEQLLAEKNWREGVDYFHFN